MSGAGGAAGPQHFHDSGLGGAAAAMARLAAGAAAARPPGGRRLRRSSAEIAAPRCRSARRRSRPWHCCSTRTMPRAPGATGAMRRATDGNASNPRAVLVRSVSSGRKARGSCVGAIQSAPDSFIIIGLTPVPRPSRVTHAACEEARHRQSSRNLRSLCHVAPQAPQTSIAGGLIASMRSGRIGDEHNCILFPSGIPGHGAQNGGRALCIMQNDLMDCIASQGTAL